MTQSPLDNDPNQLPTHRLGWVEFEDFTERLLSAHRSCAGDLRRVVRVERWGRPGDKQDGIDFEGTWSDGKSAAWQCKRYATLTEAQVRKFVRECTFEADEYYLTFSGEASSKVRTEIAKHPGWHLLDRRGLGRLFDDLPLYRQRQVLDATWGLQFRKSFLKISGEDALLPIEDHATGREDTDDLLNDRGPLIGRSGELELLTAALNRNGDWPPIILVTGAGGRGKTRLISHALRAHAVANSTLPVLSVSPGRLWDGEALRELPLTPAVIWVDDAHRDPKALIPLLSYARRTTGTQLVLSSRGSGRDQVRAELIQSGIRGGQIQEVELGRLSRREGRDLVASLSEGLQLPVALVEHLAEQAEDSPFIAVLTLNLARRGELDGPLALDQGLREQVLLRYQTVLTTDLGDSNEETIRRLLAVYAAIGPVEDSDENLRSLLMSFCKLTASRFLGLVERLKGRGVLVSRSGRTRVAPDILADQILERESIVGGVDTGFISELWTTFGAACRTRLVVTLSELDWRLTRQGHPSIIDQVGTALHDEINLANHAGLYSMVERLAPLSYTQPQLLVGLLEAMRTRLARLSQGQDQPYVSTRDEYEVSRAAAGLPPLAASDVEHELGKLYGACASNAPGTLEQALDALWALGRGDARATHSRPDHPIRVLTDKLASLGELPDPSFPERIIARVEAWLDIPTKPGDVVTPLFLLEPLLEKEGSRYVAISRREISMRPFLVSPQAARPWRDAVRRILSTQASGRDIRRARIAVELLGGALRPPHGMFGNKVDDKDIRSWEDDDLETLKTISTAAETTQYAIIRRIIRRQVEWSAEHSRILRVRHAALTLLTRLDARGDDLAEVLLGSFSLTFTDRSRKVPTLVDLEASVAAEAEDQAEQTEEEREAARTARIKSLIARRNTARDQQLERVIHLLAPDANPEIALTEIELLCRQIELSSQANAAIPGLVSLLTAIANVHTNRAGELTISIAGRAAGPLDDGLVVLLDAWSRHDKEATLTWLEAFPTQRPQIRHAIATAFTRYDWVQKGERFVALFLMGTEDPDDRVRNQFLQASYSLLKNQPAKTVDLLLDSNVSPSAATRILEGAAEFDGISWGQSLNEPDAVAVLSLISRATLHDETVQSICAGIARNFPRTAIDHLMAYERLNDLPFSVAGLPEAIEHSTPQIVSWLREQISKPLSPHAMTVVGLAMHAGMSVSQASAIADEVDMLDVQSLLNLTDLLHEVPLWASRRPLLARRILARASILGSGAMDDVRARLAEAMRLRAYAFENGVSEELEHALAIVTDATANESMDALRDEYQKARHRIATDISEVRRRFDEEYG